MHVGTKIGQLMQFVPMSNVLKCASRLACSTSPLSVCRAHSDKSNCAGVKFIPFLIHRVLVGVMGVPGRSKTVHRRLNCDTADEAQIQLKTGTVLSDSSCTVLDLPGTYKSPSNTC